jgi:quercetin dioxygenase-like cupin family protein
MMAEIDLITAARDLPEAWRSHIVGRTGNARIKLLRMDASIHAEEVHEYSEALLVLQGRLELAVAGQRRTIDAGELFMVDAYQLHAVCAGSSGILLIVDSA